MLDWAETYAITKPQEKRIKVNKARMLPWMCVVTRNDKIRNEHIRGTKKVAPASKTIHLQNDQGETTDLIWACGEQRPRAHTE